MTTKDGFSMQTEYVLAVVPQTMCRQLCKDTPGIETTMPLASVLEVTLWAKTRGLVLVKPEDVKSVDKFAGADK